MTWAVERESATVTEAHAATEVVMPLDTLRMLADQLYTVLITLVAGESFDILVGSGAGEGLEAWRRLHKLQGVVERLEDLMRRYTQRRGARNGQRHALVEDIPAGGVGSASSRRTRGTLPTPTQAESSFEGSRGQR